MHYKTCSRDKEANVICSEISQKVIVLQCYNVFFVFSDIDLDINHCKKSFIKGTGYTHLASGSWIISKYIGIT